MDCDILRQEFGQASAHSFTRVKDKGLGVAVKQTILTISLLLGASLPVPDAVADFWCCDKLIRTFGNGIARDFDCIDYLKAASKQGRKRMCKRLKEQDAMCADVVPLCTAAPVREGPSKAVIGCMVF